MDDHLICVICGGLPKFKYEDRLIRFCARCFGPRTIETMYIPFPNFVLFPEEDHPTRCHPDRKNNHG